MSQGRISVESALYMQIGRLREETTALREALREILEDPDATILDSHREAGWSAIHKATGGQS